MVTIDQFKRGLAEYVDTDILPRLSGAKRYGVMVYMALLMDGTSEKVTELLKNPAIAMLGIVDDSGLIDIDKIHDAAFNAMKDNLDIDFPLIGRFIFSRPDIDRLCDLIRRA